MKTSSSKKSLKSLKRVCPESVPTSLKSLRGIIVLDISRLLPGGYASLLLREMGARVIKVEAPGVGDYSRAIIPGGLLRNHTRVIHQDKESLELDLKNPEDRKIFKKIVKSVHVVIESFRPGILDKMGIGFQDLKKIQKTIIVCSITGFGQEGRYSHMAGHDINFVGLSGLAHKMRDSGGNPILPDFQIADMAVGMEAAMKICATLFEVRRFKKAHHIDCSMLAAAQSWARFCDFDDLMPSMLAGKIVRYGLYETADGLWISLGALEEKFWSKFCHMIGRPEWISVGFKEDIQMREDLKNIFKQKTQQEWAQAGFEADVCLFPVNEHPDYSRIDKTPAVGQDNQKF